MTDKLTDADDIELILSDEYGEKITSGEIEEFSIGFDEGDEDVEPTAIALGQTEYEFSTAFEPSPWFILWWYAQKCGAVSDD